MNTLKTLALTLTIIATSSCKENPQETISEKVSEEKATLIK